jgi:restriction system protein
VPRYWVIAPVAAKDSQLYDKVWQFDLAQNLLSIGWYQLGDISKMSQEDLWRAINEKYPERPNPTKGLIRNMLWAFYHDINVGDYVIARRGQKILSAVGKISRTGFYEVGKNPTLTPPGYTHGNFIGVEWHASPRNKGFSTRVFPMQTLAEIAEDQFNHLLAGENIAADPPPPLEVTDQSAFVLEKYLEDFIVSNFGSIFKGELQVYEGEESSGQQYHTDIGPIDILAVESSSNSFVVIELKKGQTSDKVVGQILRYMGWVKKNLCQGEQNVKGLVICRDPDPKLSYALDMTNNIDLRYYSVSFALRSTPDPSV